MVVMFFSYCKARPLQFSTNIEGTKSKDVISKYIKFFNNFLQKLSMCNNIECKYKLISQDNESNAQVVFKVKNEVPIIEIYTGESEQKNKKLLVYSDENYKVWGKSFFRFWDITNDVLDGLLKAFIMRNLNADVLNNNANIQISEIDQENNGVMEKHCSFMIIPNNRKYTILVVFDPTGKVSNFQFYKDEKTHQFYNVKLN